MLARLRQKQQTVLIPNNSIYFIWREDFSTQQILIFQIENNKQIFYLRKTWALSLEVSHRFSKLTFLRIFLLLDTIEENRKNFVCCSESGRIGPSVKTVRPKFKHWQIFAWKLAMSLTNVFLSRRGFVQSDLLQKILIYIILSP